MKFKRILIKFPGGIYMSSVVWNLKERGYIAQLTHEEKIKELLEKEKNYILYRIWSHCRQSSCGTFPADDGHGPHAKSGTQTHSVNRRRYSHGRRPHRENWYEKNDDPEEIKHNADCFKKQLSKFIEFGEGKAIMVDNADWLLDLNYIEFLRDIGVHFSVNRMLTAECFKSRLERGLSFIEFNYMLMQSYDFPETV